MDATYFNSTFDSLFLQPVAWLQLSLNQKVKRRRWRTEKQGFFGAETRRDGGSLRHGGMPPWHNKERLDKQWGKKNWKTRTMGGCVCKTRQNLWKTYVTFFVPGGMSMYLPSDLAFELESIFNVPLSLGRPRLPPSLPCHRSLGGLRRPKMAAAAAVLLPGGRRGGGRQAEKSGVPWRIFGQSFRRFGMSEYLDLGWGHIRNKLGELHWSILEILELRSVKLLNGCECFWRFQWVCFVETGFAYTAPSCSQLSNLSGRPGEVQPGQCQRRTRGSRRGHEDMARTTQGDTRSYPDPEVQHFLCRYIL